MTIKKSTRVASITSDRGLMVGNTAPDAVAEDSAMKLKQFAVAGEEMKLHEAMP